MQQAAGFVQAMAIAAAMTGLLIHLIKRSGKNSEKLAFKLGTE